MSVTSLFEIPKRKAIRQPDNPLDKSTIVSIFPREIVADKPTLQPGRWTIPAGTLVNPSISLIRPSSWFKDIDPDSDPIEIVVSSLLIANSIIDDYCNGLHACDMGELRPGLFWLPGEVTLEQVKKEHGSLLNLAAARQKNWFTELVVQADAFWARSNGNPMAISHLQRLAATELGLNREWLRSHQEAELVKCIACGALRDAAYPVCGHCKAIVDPEKAKGLQFAK